MSRILDLTGQTFGTLKVLCLTVAPADRENKSGTWWLCECACGAREVISGVDLRENRRKQCRICKAASRDMTGQEHGTWLVIREATEDEIPDVKSANRTSWWKVRCVLCGKDAIRSRDQLKKFFKQCSCVGVPAKPKPFVVREPDNTIKRPLPERNKRCRQCGKIFELETYGQWGWTIGSDYFCTYKCMRLWEKTPKAKKYKRKGLANE